MREQAPYLHRGHGGAYDHVLILTLDYVQEGGQWVGVCLELGTSTFAESLETVRQELREAVALQL
jgi:predicted RNase H-like HicB family nuclease